MEHSFWQSLKLFLHHRFNLEEDKGDESEVVDTISKNVEFKGTNLWILIFAIFMASIGLNVNSTAVIIGAMLISPLMGPIMGIGLGVGIYDFDLIKKALRNFVLAVIIGILTSTLYFLVSPLSEANSELLARTTPTIWDVFIAFFGGLAGIVAGSRKDKSITVIPGVAIATALMPPLCTAGYGIATANFSYFAGAMYLFFINSVFISLSTYLIVRSLKYTVKSTVDPVRSRKVRQYITIIVVLTLLPSIYLGYDIVERSIFENNVNRFITSELQYNNTQVINQKILYASGKRIVEITLIGEPITEEEKIRLQEKQLHYNIAKATLNIRQGFGTVNPDMNKIKDVVFAEIYSKSEKTIDEKNSEIEKLKRQIRNYGYLYEANMNIGSELKKFFPGLIDVSLAQGLNYNTKTSTSDSIVIVNASFKSKISKSDHQKIKEWLEVRTGKKNIRLIIN